MKTIRILLYLSFCIWAISCCNKNNLRDFGAFYPAPFKGNNKITDIETAFGKPQMNYGDSILVYHADNGRFYIGGEGDDVVVTQFDKNGTLCNELVVIPVKEGRSFNNTVMNIKSFFHLVYKDKIKRGGEVWDWDWYLFSNAKSLKKAKSLRDKGNLWWIIVDNTTYPDFVFIAYLNALPEGYSLEDVYTDKKGSKIGLSFAFDQMYLWSQSAWLMEKINRQD